MADLRNRNTFGATHVNDADGAARTTDANRSVRWKTKSIDTNILYVAEAVGNASETDAVWNISELNKSAGTLRMVQQVDGNQYSFKWSERESLTYA